MCFKVVYKLQLAAETISFCFFLPEKFLGSLLFVAYHFSIVYCANANDNPEMKRERRNKEDTLIAVKMFYFKQFQP